jgi:L-threonylcarbamoyladenylate synthase
VRSVRRDRRARGGSPLAATSANVSGGKPSISAREVAEFARQVDLDLPIVDGGIAPQWAHMTIVDCATPGIPVRIEREGTIHPRAILAALGLLRS